MLQCRTAYYIMKIWRECFASGIRMQVEYISVVGVCIARADTDIGRWKTRDAERAFLAGKSEN